MSEFDEVVASPSVLTAGRFEPDGRVAEHKSPGLRSGWLPLRSWTYSGDDYVSAMHGDRFLIAKRANLEAWTT
jgi:roadblock/LC7 domain-containing protein